MIECKFSLELTKNGIQKSIHAKAGENQARKLIITLTESGSVFELSGLNAQVTYDNKNRSEDLPISGNTVEFVIPSGLTAMAGVRICELKIYRDTQVIYSPMFEVVVEESLGREASEEPLGNPAQYQEAIADSAVKDTDMQSDDYVVIYDTATGKVMRLPWSDVKDILVVTKHSVLEERDAENQHPISAIEGLQDALDTNAGNITAAEQKAAKDLSIAEAALNLSLENTKQELNEAIAELSDEIDNTESSLQGQVTNISNDIEQNIRPTVDELSAAVEGMKATIDHTHENKVILDKFGINAAGTRPTFLSDNNVLAYQSDVAARVAEHRAEVYRQLANLNTERPTAIYEHDFNNYCRMTTAITSDNTFQIGFFVEDEMTEFFNVDETTVAETELIGKEIADIEFELISGECVSIKNMYAVDNVPYISLMNKIERNQVTDAEVGVLFAAIHYPSNVGFLADGAISKMRMIYYTD